MIIGYVWVLGIGMGVSMYDVEDRVMVNGENFECGYDGGVSMVLKNKWNYWMITIHFLVFEVELCMMVWVCFKLGGVSEDRVLGIIFSVLLVDMGVFFKIRLVNFAIINGII